MIDKNKKYALAALSATTIICGMGTSKVDADSNIGEVTAYSLNVRSGPSTSDAVIGGLKEGDKIEILSSQNGWYKIKYNNRTGWVSGDYIIKSSSSTESTLPNTSVSNKKLVANRGVNVRTGGSTKYKKIGYIKKNHNVEMLGVASSGWYKVKLPDGTIGYSSNKYLSEIEINAESSLNNNPNSSDIATESLIATANLNLRTGPSIEYLISGVVYKGDTVSVIEHTSDSWYKIKLSNGKTGYCSASYLKSQSQIDSATNKPESESDISYTLDVKAYAYYTGTITATGTKPTFGRTIAVDPKIIPYGTRVYIPEFDKTFIAEDCGGGIKGNKIDIYMNTKEECINWGVRNITLYILK